MLAKVEKYLTKDKQNLCISVTNGYIGHATGAFGWLLPKRLFFFEATGGDVDPLLIKYISKLEKSLYRKFCLKRQKKVTKKIRPSKKINQMSLSILLNELDVWVSHDAKAV